MKHSKQNRFAGSVGQRPAPKGGLQTVHERDVIGPGECWCWGLICWPDGKGGRDWAGKDHKKPHPRTKEDEMAATQDHLAPKDLKTYGQELSALLMTLVNDCGVRVRILDGASMLLYPPDGVSRPFKITSNRPEKNTLGYLKSKFIVQYDIHVPKKEDRKTEPVKAATPKPTPPKSSVTEPTEKKETPDVGEPTTIFSNTPTPPVAVKATGPAPMPKVEEAKKTASAPPAEPPKPNENPWLGDVSYDEILERVANTELPEGWKNYSTRDAKRTIMMTNDEGVLQCIVCWAQGIETILSSGRSVGGHFVANHSGGKMWTPAARSKGTETYRENRKREVVESSIYALMEAFEIEPPVVEVKSSDTKEVEALRARLAKAEAQRDEAVKRADDLEAKISLMREALTV